MHQTPTRNDSTLIPAGTYQALSANLYYDTDIFEAERQQIFARSWQFVGHQTQLTSAGDYFTCDTAGENIIVIRGHDEQLRAFYNVCRHRGHVLLERAGHVDKIVCPYHAWRYENTGRFSAGAQVDSYPDFDAGCFNLKQVRLEIFHGLIFVNLDRNAQNLNQLANHASQEIAAYLPDLAQCVFAHRTEHLINANWKIVIENFSECYHCPTVHKSFTQGVVDPKTYRIVPKGFCQRHISQSQQGDKRAYDFDGESDFSDEFAAWYLWPLMAVQVYPGRVGMTFRWRPLSVDQTKVEVDWWLHSSMPSQLERDLIAQHAETTFMEDIIPLVESVHQGMQSAGFDHATLVVNKENSLLSEHPVVAFQEFYRDAMESD